MKNKEKQKPKREKAVRRSLIGGQALMEGVLMRGKTAEAMAVRTPDGEIVVETKRLKTKGQWYKKVPIVRGLVAFFVSLVSGMSALMKSATASGEEEETPSGWMMTLSMLIGIILAVGLFIVLPWLSTTLLGMVIDFKTMPWLSGIIEGVVRVLIFILYLLLVSRMKDIRRTFMYHGAEHRTINCYEKGLDMTVENVQKCSTRHNRCGTTFLFFVVVLSIIVFSLTNWLLSLTGLEIFENRFMQLAIRLALLPIVAGLSYELLRGLAALPDNGFTNVLRAPGLALQRLTTYPPDDDMAEVALKSFLTVLAMDEDESIKEVKFFERDFDEVKTELKAKLRDSGKSENDFDFILRHVLNIPKGKTFEVKKLVPEDYKKVRSMVLRRAGGEPLDYILGNSEFYGETLKITDKVLCPRPETELLVERAIKAIGESKVKVLDLCTGSGAIAKALARTNAEVYASDIDDGALEVAKENLEGSGVTVIKSDMLSEFNGYEFDLIVTNPPYIKSADMASLPPEVMKEPALALDGGEDGLKFYRAIIDGLKNGALKTGGGLFAEIGYDIGENVKELFAELFESVTVEKDYGGNDRMVICTGFKGNEVL